jgi:hypothetical protein
MHVYAVTLALASVAVLVALFSVYLCRVECTTALDAFSAASTAAAEGDDARWMEALDRVHRATTVAHRLAAFALGCMLGAAVFVWSVTVRFCERPKFGPRRVAAETSK